MSLTTAGIGLGCLCLFFGLAIIVTRGATDGFDRSILLAMRNPADLADPWGPAWFEEMMRDFTAFGGVAGLTLFTGAVTGFLALRGFRRDAIGLALTVLASLILSSVLKYGFDRPRPDLVAHGSFVYTSSFPSGHALMSATTYLTMGALLARVQTSTALRVYIMTLSIAITLLVGISRVYLGVHWPTDVIAGWAIGAGCALTCTAMVDRLGGRDTPAHAS